MVSSTVYTFLFEHQYIFLWHLWHSHQHNNNRLLATECLCNKGICRFHMLFGTVSLHICIPHLVDTYVQTHHLKYWNAFQWNTKYAWQEIESYMEVAVIKPLWQITLPKILKNRRSLSLRTQFSTLSAKFLLNNTYAK